MILKGREIKFLRTVNATCEIADLCPDGDIAKVDRLFLGRYSQSQINCAKFIQIMNKGYEDNCAYENDEYDPVYLDEKGLLYLPQDVFQELLTEASEAFSKGVERTVETAEDKSGKKTEQE